LSPIRRSAHEEPSAPHPEVPPCLVRWITWLVLRRCGVWPSLSS
jgi:hypothetical protein